MGEPSSLSAEQISILQAAAKPLITAENLISDKKIKFGLEVKPNGVIYFEIKKVNRMCDRGFEY